MKLEKNKARQKVKIQIITEQFSEENGKDRIEEFFYGTMIEKAGKTYVLYDEIQAHEEINTRIKIDDDYVSIGRSGGIKTLLRFIEDADTESLYSCIQGDFYLKIFTRKVEVDVGEEEINIDLDYDLRIIGLFDGKNKVNIKITKIN